MNPNQFLAHPDQSLVEHLLGVTRRAQDFAAHFQGKDHAKLAGLLHDLGKAEEGFKARMIAIKAGKQENPRDKKPHAPHGAAVALANQLWPVAFAINGHHAGLHNRSSLQQVSAKWTKPAESCKESLIGDSDWPPQPWPITDFGQTLPAWLEQISFATAGERDAKMRAVEFYTRMLFSALVDADRLDTEESNPATGSQANVLKRKAWHFGPECLAKSGNPESLLEMLDTAIQERVDQARSKHASDAVLDVRAKVLAACKAKAANERGVFTLPVPTGGGKTLASIAFALHHIAHHNKKLVEGDPRRLRRIIVVIPYLNIIQQTTRELRMVFGDLVWEKDALDPHTGKTTKHPTKEEQGAWVENTDPDHRPLILEHHSQASDPKPEDDKPDKKDHDSDGYSKERPLRQLAAENWDAPVIVTTSVQFFDSLFSRRPADARKLHNICQSVLIFDEVQTLPPLLLQPILDALKELTAPLIDETETDPGKRNEQRPYGCSLVLCTATQPALGHDADDFPFGFKRRTPIIDDQEAREHFKALQRVEYHGLTKAGEPETMDNEALVAAMRAASRQQALAILNTRKQARKLFDLLAEKTQNDDSIRGAIFHLSTWMYPAHRVAVLIEVRKRLDEKKPCLLVSTQCVEAGVDVDFPAVWRAFGPYDSIVQAAGRCNRNGALKDAAGQSMLGHVHVFTPADAAAPQGVYASAMQTALLLCRMDKADPHDPDSFERYFRLLYQANVPDPGGCAVQSAREKLHFEEVSKLFNFIDADSVPLLIPNEAWAKEHAPEGSEDGMTMLEWLQTKKRTRRYKGKDIPGGFLTPDDWRLLQPYIVNLSFPESKMTQAFLRASDSEPVFKNDDPIRGLRLLKSNSQLYHSGLNKPGLDVNCEALSDPANYVL